MKTLDHDQIDYSSLIEEFNSHGWRVKESKHRDAVVGERYLKLNDGYLFEEYLYAIIFDDSTPKKQFNMIYPAVLLCRCNC